MKTSFRFLTGGHLHFRQTFPLFIYATKGRENYCVIWRSLHTRKHALHEDHVGLPSVGAQYQRLNNVSDFNECLYGNSA